MHGVARVLVRHVLERVMWKGGEEASKVESGDKAVKGWFLKSLGVEDVEGEVKELAKKGGETVAPGGVAAAAEEPEDATGFWTRDEGLEEIRKNLKDA